MIGFRVAPEDRAVSLAEEKKIEIRRYDIIYQVTDEIRKAVEGMLVPEIKEVHLGRAVVRQVFKISKVGTVAGCFVTQGTIERSAKARVIRDGREIYKSSIDALKRFKDDVREVREGFECGIKITNFDDLKSRGHHRGLPDRRDPAARLPPDLSGPTGTPTIGIGACHRDRAPRTVIERRRRAARVADSPGRSQGRVTMTVATLRLDLRFRHSFTSKDTRRQMKGIMDKLHKHFNVSVAEADLGGDPRRRSWSLPRSASMRRESETLERVADAVPAHPRAEILAHAITEV